MSTAVKFEHVSKMYRLGFIGTGTLGDDVHRWWVTRVMRKPDPYLMVGETNDRTSKGNSNYVFALRDINFELEEGEVLGIIGKNGAGKSTLLKLLAHVTTPSIGKVCNKGRIASLLEVGTGFHGELSGRENIYLNGAILGMRKWEINKHLDEIIAFSGCERYIDTPVKRYSSGMIVRLGFAVAAYLEPEILIVDEVLAVGDAEFQKKAVGKIRDVAKNSGRTVLFVSHNMASVRSLCSKGLFLENGTVRDMGETDYIIDEYLKTTQQIETEQYFEGDSAPGNRNVKLRHIFLINDAEQKVATATINQRIGVRMEYEVLRECEAFNPVVHVSNEMGVELFVTHNTNKMSRDNVRPGRYETTLWIPANLMQAGETIFGFSCHHYTPDHSLFPKTDVAKITYLDTLASPTRNEDYRGALPGAMRPLVEWETVKRL